MHALIQKPDIVHDMMNVTREYEGKASPGNQHQIIVLLRSAGYRMGEITDHLPQLMYHLGNSDDML